MKTDSKDLKQLKDKTFVLTLTIPQSDIKNEYQSVLKKVAQNFEIKGFRKGKAPLDVVEQNVSQAKILEEVIENLASRQYADKIKQYDLKPIVTPQFKFLNPPISLDKDWQIELTSCETPDVTIDPKFQQNIKKVNGQKDTKDKQTKTNQILDSLLINTKVTMPSVLIDTEVNHRLSHLVESVTQAGMTVDQYFASQKSSLDAYREEQKAYITKEWTLNLALDKIASDQKIEVTPEDIQKVAANYPKDTRLDLNLLAYVIRQQKTLDYLQSL